MKLKKLDTGAPPMRAGELVRELQRVVLLQPLRWLLAFLASPVLLALEAGLLGSIYLLIDLDKRRAAAEHVRAWMPGALWPGLSPEGLLPGLFVAGVGLLGLLLVLRYRSERNILQLQEELGLFYAGQLVARYLASSNAAARAVGKERITSSIIHDCRWMGLYCRTCLTCASAVLSTALYVGAALLISAKMLVVAGLVYLVPLYVNRRGYRKIRQIGHTKISAQERLLGYFADVLNGFERLKLDALEDPIRWRSIGIIRQDWEWKLDQQMTRIRINLVTDCLAFLGLFVVLFAGIVIFRVDLAALVILFVIFVRMKGHVATLSNAYTVLVEKLPHVYRYFHLLKELTPAPRAPRRGQGADQTLSSVACRQVWFRHSDRNEWVLRSVDFEAGAGQRIWIQGPSGHGKSTLLLLLCGLLTPSRGQVHLDGEVLTEDVFYRVRDRIAFVSPAIYLFDDTLRNNLLLGCPDREGALGEALARSALDRVVADFPDGLDTRTGTNGSHLSLGQRQRVILARLFLKRPRLVLLDEATANLEEALEEQVMRNLVSFLDPRAVLILAAHKQPRGITFDRHLRLESSTLTELPRPRPAPVAILGGGDPSNAAGGGAYRLGVGSGTSRPGGEQG
jgi:ABC-type bacteriocin/lantibiotic exporter with double-glycine peptidase domain